MATGLPGTKVPMPEARVKENEPACAPDADTGCARTAPLAIEVFAAADTQAVVALWQACGLTRPWNDPYMDIARKQSVQPELFLLAREGAKVVATIMAGFDGHRGWVNYLAVADTHRGQGLGRALMREVEQRLQLAGCPKINLMVRNGNDAVLAFYTHLGYVVEDSVALGKRLIGERPNMRGYGGDTGCLIFNEAAVSHLLASSSAKLRDAIGLIPSEISSAAAHKPPRAAGSLIKLRSNFEVL